MSIQLARVYSESEVRTQVRHAVRALGHANHKAATAHAPDARAAALATAARLSALAFTWHATLTEMRQRAAERQGHPSVVVPFSPRAGA